MKYRVTLGIGWESQYDDLFNLFEDLIGPIELGCYISVALILERGLLTRLEMKKNLIPLFKVALKAIYVLLHSMFTTNQNIL